MKQLIAVLLVAMFAVSAFAGGLKYSDGDKYLKLGGRIQLQYVHTDEDDGDSTDEVRFRRLRPYIEGSVHKDWMGKWQFDLGKGEVALKDAYFAYKGIEGVQIAVGNANTPYSRELLTSSKKQQLIERTFVGDHNYGTPDRQAGVHLTGKTADMFTYGVSVAKAAHDPDDKKLDFESIVDHGAGDDWSEGNMIVARADVHPFGILKMEQGDFKRDLKATVGISGYSWGNDDDNLDAEREKHDLDTATGVEISGAIRVAGVSIDAQYNSVDAELKDASISNGLYNNGETTLENYAVEGGVMLVPSKLELVAGYQSQDADGYATEWTKTSVGLNYFVKKHDIKYMVTYDMGENKDGKEGNDVDEVYVQAQYVF